jgi:hypothetical protein
MKKTAQKCKRKARGGQALQSTPPLAIIFSEQISLRVDPREEL